MQTSLLISYIMIFASALIMIFGVFGVFMWYMLFFRFKHWIEFICITPHGRQVIIKRAREFYDKKNKVTKWKIRFPVNLPKEIVVPKNTVMDFTKKGKFFARAYVTELGEIIFTTAKHPKIVEDLFERLMQVPEHINKEMDLTTRQTLYDQWRKEELSKFQREHQYDNYIIHKPITTNQRQMIINEFKEAASREDHGPGNHLQLILNLVLVILMAVIIIFGIVQWKDLNQPGIDKAKEVTQQKQLELEQMQVLADIKLGMDRLEGKSENGEQKAPN